MDVTEIDVTAEMGVDSPSAAGWMCSQADSAWMCSSPAAAGWMCSTPA